LTAYSIEPGRRVLFVLHEPGYFRLYGSTIVEMGRRGWIVMLAFDNPEKRGEAQVPAGASANVQSLGALPGGVRPLAATLRAVVDYLRYLEPAFAHATYLRRRVRRTLPRRFVFLTRIAGAPRWAVSAAIALSRAAEHLLPVDQAVLEFLRTVRPEVVVVSPVVIVGRSGARQTEVIKAARALGIPVLVGVASWDHLTSKGLIRVVPDALAVWNGVQAREAEFLHRVPASKIIVTGAQPMDHWFEPAQPDATEEFRRRLAIPAGRPVVLFTGSSRKMAPPDSEVQFVRRWLSALRGSGDPAVRSAFIIVRPHPSNTEQWDAVDLGDPDAVVSPRTYSGLPLRDDEVEAFRQSLLASHAVVGVNTTAMIEAAILERPVFSVRDAAFTHSQRQTLHFDYLTAEQGGCVTVADSLADHVRHLAALLAGGAGDPGAATAAQRFVERFVRPLDRSTPATMHLCDAIEHLATPERRTAHEGHRERDSRDYSVAFGDSRRH
jgi:hypothetical protein